jgi:sodium-dependent dicarboxylate transporter 2/3/5
MIPVTLSCSCAFMMPVATPPNAIVFGTDRLRIQDMARVGLLLNLVGVVLIVVAMHLLGGLVWGIEAGAMPDWAR